METLVLTVHILIALALIGVVLLQRSEGGGLGIGGGGGGHSDEQLEDQTSRRAISYAVSAAASLLC